MFAFALCCAVLVLLCLYFAYTVYHVPHTAYRAYTAYCIPPTAYLHGHYIISAFCSAYQVLHTVCHTAHPTPHIPPIAYIPGTAAYRTYAAYFIPHIYYRIQYCTRHTVLHIVHIPHIHRIYRTHTAQIPHTIAYRAYTTYQTHIHRILNAHKPHTAHLKELSVAVHAVCGTAPVGARVAGPARSRQIPSPHAPGGKHNRDTRHKKTERILNKKTEIVLDKNRSNTI